MDRNQILTIIEAAYAARMRGDAAALSKIWAAGASFELAGEKTLLGAFPAQGPAQPAAEALINLIEISALERLEAVVEGNRAAILWRATMSFAGREAFESLLYDLWELDEAGKVCALLQFADTARIASEMRALAGDIA